MQNFLLTSLIASVVLTIVLNVVLRIGAVRRRQRDRPDQVARPGFTGWPEPTRPETQDEFGIDERSHPRTQVKVFFPWKIMLALSIGLTILINVIGLLAR